MENRTTNVFFLKGYEYRLEEEINIETPFKGFDVNTINDIESYFLRITKKY